MAGRPPKPTALKQLHGTLRPDRQVDNEPDPGPAEDMGPPDWLVGEEANELWLELAPKLWKLRLLTDLDRVMLAQYCFAHQTWRRAAVKIEADEVAPNDPLIWQFNKAVDVMIKVATHFGMSPASRSRINVPTEKPTSNINFRKRG